MIPESSRSKSWDKILLQTFAMCSSSGSFFISRLYKFLERQMKSFVARSLKHRSVHLFMSIFTFFPLDHSSTHSQTEQSCFNGKSTQKEPSFASSCSFLWLTSRCSRNWIFSQINSSMVNPSNSGHNWPQITAAFGKKLGLNWDLVDSKLRWNDIEKNISKKANQVENAELSSLFIRQLERGFHIQEKSHLYLDLLKKHKQAMIIMMHKIQQWNSWFQTRITL